VAIVASQQFATGKRPTLDSVRSVIGKGSATTIQSALNNWWEDIGRRFRDQAHHPALPDSIADAANIFWQAAMKEAEKAFDKHREEADARVVEAEISKRQAEESSKAAEESRQAVQGMLESANATIDGLERTLSAESAHKASLEKQVTELRAEAQEARLDADRVRREAAQEVDLIRKDASQQIERAGKEFRDQMDLAQARFDDTQKRMLVEIDRERQAASLARQESQKQIDDIKADARLAESNLRQRIAELTGRISELTMRAARLEGQLDEVTKQRDRLLAEVSAVSTKKRKQEGKREQVAEARQARMKRNAPVFEAFHDEIVERLDDGEKAGEIATWLNGRGFEGGGAALNALLKQAGLL
jgi:chromosome segregation ATPase